MGGAVSSGRDNDELVDNLISGNYIRSRMVEKVFRSLDRADYMSAEARDQAYKDLAWRNGPLHLSAPCIYSEVMEALELKPGLSFLNVGSGTGYLSTLVGLIIGSAGTSHGVETVPVVTDYANKKLTQFIDNCITLDEFDFCVPKYYKGNGLCLAPTHTYDRVYCGAGVLSKYENYFKQFTKVGGVLVMPLSDTLVQLRRVSDTHWTKRNLLNVSFALLRDPLKEELEDLLKLEPAGPPTLQLMCRGVIRSAMRAGLQRRNPDLQEPPAPPAPPPRTGPRTGPRRISIPFDAASNEELNELHELDEAGGAHEMNALLSLVLSMGQNRAAGSLRFDPVNEADLHEDYAEVGEMYAVEGGEERDRPAPPQHLLPNDGVIVFDVSQRSMRARRWNPRLGAGASAPPDERADPAEPAPPSPRTTAVVTFSMAPSTSTAEPVAEITVSETDEDARPGVATQTFEAVPPETFEALAPEPFDEVYPPEVLEAVPSETPEANPPEPAERRPAGESRSPPPRHADLPLDSWGISSSDDDDDDAAQGKDNKRQKLDSGIGEGTASSGASPDKSDDKSSASCKSRAGADGGTTTEDTDMQWCDEDILSDTTSDSDSDSDSESESAGAPAEAAAKSGAPAVLKRKKLVRCTFKESAPNKSTEGRRRVAQRTCALSVCRGGAAGPCGARPPPARDMRRVRLSLAMKRGVRELPLPHALKKYINYERCYQF